MPKYARPYLTKKKSNIIKLDVARNNFNIKLSIIKMVKQFMKFDGLQDEDLNVHIVNFLEICYTFIINGITDDAI